MASTSIPQKPELPAALGQARLGIWLLAITSMQMVGAFAIQWYIVRVLGASKEADALYAGMGLPTVLLTVFSGSLVYVAVPLLSTQSVNVQKRNGWALLAAVVLVFGSLAAALEVSMGFWLPILVPGLTAESLGMAAELTRIQLPILVGGACQGVLIAICNARGRFVRAAVALAAAQLLGFAGLVAWLPSQGIRLAAWIQAGVVITPVIFLLPELGWPQNIFRASGFLRTVISRMRPLVLGSVYYKCDTLVDRYFASFLAPGNMVLYLLANRIYAALQQVLGRAVGAPMVPRLARFANSNRWEQFRREGRYRLVIILLATLVVFGVIAVSGTGPLVAVFGSQRFTEGDSRLLWRLLLALGGTLVAGAAGEILASSFYAFGNTRTPTWIGVVGFTVGIAMKFVGFMYLGVIGVALAASAYYVLNAILLQWFLSRWLQTLACRNRSGWKTPGARWGVRRAMRPSSKVGTGSAV